MLFSNDQCAARRQPQRTAVCDQAAVTCPHRSLGTWIRHFLVKRISEQMPALHEKLQAGILVADVGCGVRAATTAQLGLGCEPVGASKMLVLPSFIAEGSTVSICPPASITLHVKEQGTSPSAQMNIKLPRGRTFITNAGTVAGRARH